MHKNVKSTLVVLASAFLLSACVPAATDVNTAPTLSPIEYVNPYVGNISHLLVPTFPTISYIF